MKYKGRLIACCLCAAILGCNDPSQVPWGVYVSPTEENFGTVEDQASVVGQFTVANNTPEPVHIVHTRVSCGCTRLELSDHLIPPRGTVSARMMVDLKGRYGKQQFESLLITDCDLAPVLRLGVNVTVAVSDLDGQLPFDIGAVPPDAEINETVSMWKHGDSAARITAVEQSPNDILKIEPLPRNDPDFFWFRVVGRAPKQAGSFRTVAQLAAEGMSWKRAKISVQGVVRSRWTCPEELYLGFVRAGETVKKDFHIRDTFADKNAPALVRNVSVSSASGSMEVTGNPDGGGARVALTLKHTGSPGPFASEVTVKVETVDQQKHVFKIPVYAHCLK